MPVRTLSQPEWDMEKPFLTDYVSVRNLSHVLTVGSDTWGRTGKSQPINISVTLGLSQPFSTAAATDSVDSSTIHYGLLSKTIMSLCEHFEREPRRQLLALLYLLMDGLSSLENFLSIVSCLKITLTLPKASRYGQGISIDFSHCFSKHIACIALRLEQLAIPCIIGVNDHERSLKQLVMATVSIDKSEPDITEDFQQVEQIVVKTIEESAFETLEAMAEEVAARVMKYIVWAPRSYETGVAGVRVRLEKPSAVPFADAPAIEIYRSAKLDDPIAQRLFSEMGIKRIKVPFPLESRLDEFLQSSKQD